MEVEAHLKLGSPHVFEASRLVVRDINGTPILVMLEHAPGQYWIKRFGDEDFERALKIMGLDDIVVVEHVDGRSFQAPPGELVLPPGM